MFQPKCYPKRQGFLAKKGLIERSALKAQFEEKSAIKAHWSVSLSFP